MDEFETPWFFTEYELPVHKSIKQIKQSKCVKLKHNYQQEQSTGYFVQSSGI